MGESIHEKMMRQHGDQTGPGMHTGSMAKELASFEATFKSKRQIAEGTYEFTFEKPADLHFSAGQHIRMTLINPSENDAEGDKRFLTMASTPQEPDLRFAMRMRDTAFKRVLGHMKPGEKVVLQKLLGESPHGSFVLHDDVTKPAVFIVGGIGIVPAYSMIKDATERKLPHKLFLFYSNRRPEDAPYLAELQTLAKQNPNFTLVATMTESEKSAKKWRGETGVIDRLLLEKYVSDLLEPIYYTAGLPEMVSAMKAILADASVSDDNIRAEEFTGFNLNELQSVSTRNRKNYLLIAAVVVVLLALLAVHTGVFGSLSHSNLFTSFSFSNPISYLITVALLAVVAVKIAMALKVKRILHAKQSGQKLSVRDVLEAHNPIKRR
jgi:ferredoxin-NADP reductase